MQQFRQRYYKLYPKAVECLEDGSAMLLTYFSSQSGIGEVLNPQM